jgi:hypothetical protein
LRRLPKPIAQLRQELGLQDRRRRAVAATQIAESLGSFGVVTREQLFDPSLAERRRRRDLRNCVTTRQKPDRMEMPRCGGVATRHISLFQLLHAQMLVDDRHGSAPRLMARQPICFAKPRESPCNVESISRRPYQGLVIPHLSQTIDGTVEAINAGPQSLKAGRGILARVHQLNSIFAIFRVSDHDNPLVLKGRCL